MDDLEGVRKDQKLNTYYQIHRLFWFRGAKI